MIRVLVLIAVAGFFVCLVSLGGAAALGGADLARNGWVFPVDWNWEDDRDGPHVDFSGPTVTRTVDWPGAGELVVAVPAEVVFTQAATPRLVITGPKTAVDKIEVNGGEISFSGRTRARARIGFGGVDVDFDDLNDASRLKIEIAAPDVRSVTASVASKMVLNGIKRPDFQIKAHAGSDVSGRLDVDRLAVEIHSGAEAALQGRADRLDAEVHSGGDARLEGLAVKSAQVVAHSAGEVSLAAAESADVEVHSGADVTLFGRPPQLHTDVHSGGDIHYREAPASAAGAVATTQL